MIDFSSIIVFLCASLGPGAFCCVCNITRPAYIVNLLFTIVLSAHCGAGFAEGCETSCLTLAMHRLLLNHLKHVTGSRYAPWCSGPCASAWTSFLDLRVSSTFSLCGTSFGTSAPTLLAVLSQLFCHTGLLRELFACCWLCSCFMGSWVPGCFTFFTAIWRVFHSTKSNDFNANFSFGITAAVHSMEPAQF